MPAVGLVGSLDLAALFHHEAVTGTNAAEFLKQDAFCALVRFRHEIARCLAGNIARRDLPHLALQPLPALSTAAVITFIRGVLIIGALLLSRPQWRRFSMRSSASGLPIRKARGKSSPVDAKGRRFMRIWSIVLVGAVATYGVVAGGLYGLQRSILFQQNTHYLMPQAVPQLRLGSRRSSSRRPMARRSSPGTSGCARQAHHPLLSRQCRASALHGRSLRTASAEGLGLMALAYRGYSGSTGSPSEAGLMIDAATAYDWLAARVPADQIIIHGAALGSTVAAKLAAEKPARELVLEAPYTSALAVMSSRFWFLPIPLMMKDPFRAEEAITKVKMPILIIHGEGDEVVPLYRAEAVLALAPEPKKFVTIAKGSHNNLSELGLYKEIAAFADASAPK